jgi:radical SAM superfamily enzyme YgiQ (UPF0313 family)
MNAPGQALLAPRKGIVADGLPVTVRRTTPVRPERRMSVLLVGLYSSRYAAIGESHGLSVIAGVLAAAPNLVAQLDVLDMATYGDERPDRIVAAIRGSRPDVIGVAVLYGAYSVLVNAYPTIRAAADAAGARVVFGGALATYLSAELLDLAPAAVVVSGEGERPMLGLLGVWSRGSDDIGDVEGVTFRAGTRSCSSVGTLDPAKYDELRGVRNGLATIMQAIATVREAGRHVPEFRTNYMTVITRHEFRDLPGLIARCVET